MAEEQDENTTIIDDRIIAVIRRIKKDRNRAGYQNIFTFLNRNEPKLDMQTLKARVNNMVERGVLLNKGKGDNESFFISETNLHLTTEGEENGDDELRNLKSYIDDKLYEVLINKIKTEVKNVVSCEINILKESNELKVINITEPKEKVNDVLLNSLNNEISFLRKELESKDAIIHMLLNDRCNNTCTINKVKKKHVISNSNFNNEINADVQSNVETTKNEANKSNLSESSEQVADANAEYIEVKAKKTTTNKRQITLLGDSIIKNIQPHKMKRCMKSNEKIYIKSFPGASTADMKDYARPSQRYNPDVFILHTGSNDLRSTKSPNEISDEIVKLALDIKTDKNEVIISSIVCRGDELNEKALKVNDFLKIKTDKYALGYMNNSNICVDTHLNGSGMHLNYSGTVTLANNFLKIINV